MSIYTQTYRATLFTPLFYSSRDGRVVETNPRLSATALMHALGYTYFDLPKSYVMLGEEANTPDYSPLANLPLFVSDMEPIAVDASERTFRTTSYYGDFNFTTKDAKLAKRVTGKNGIPKIQGKSDTGWHEVRHYMGLSPGSTFEFTIWTTEPDALPETLFFRMGIKLSGEFRAVPAESTQDHTLNKFLLEDVYKLTDAELGELLSRSDKLERGNDPRLHHFVGVEPGAVEDTVLPHVINTDSQ